MMPLKDYQSGAVAAFGRWLDELARAERQSQKASAALEAAGLPVPDSIRDYPKAAWDALAAAGGVAPGAGRYVSRTDAAGRPIPHVCLKVPTGGGKTLLAAAALDRLGRQTGLTLWVVPTRAIYEQTRIALRTRQHPYRQILERASGGRVKLFEKETPISALDLENYMCVMLLMLPAANRQKGRQFLRMFRDSGRYPTLFPDSGDALGEARLLDRFPDLERIRPGGPPKQSLFNVFKMLRPVVVLDEAHKAYGKKREAGEEFARSVNRLDPRMTIELSATPTQGISNLLVDIRGSALKAEEMIKLPVQVFSVIGAEWTQVLANAHGELERLEAEAQSLQASEGRYIRPVAVVRVERTGKDQRDGLRVHAEDVRERLVRHLGVPQRAVAVKSAERNELAGVDLMSELCPIRWVITKSALMEGWDCPFAYVLAMLDNTTAKRALTQLVGRVMRQPHAQRTGREPLDCCYVHCWNTEVGKAVSFVKAGLEEEGLTGLGGDVVADSPTLRRVAVRRRSEFRGTDIFLPRVLHKDGAGWRELEYLSDIVPGVDWEGIDAPDPRASQAEAPAILSAVVDLGEGPAPVYNDRELAIDKTVRISWFVYRLCDIVPNPWQAARIVQQFVGKLRAGGETDDAIFDRRAYLAHMLHKHVAETIERDAERVFMEKIARKEIRFDLKIRRLSFRIPEDYELVVPERAGLFAAKDGGAIQRSLFEPIYGEQFDSDLEQKFARYLDERKALQWWHRVAARQGGDYYLKGWKPDRVWPDFVAMGGGTPERPRLLVFETKGAHLDNADTAYKKRLMDTLRGAFDCGTMTVADGPAKGTFRIVFDEAEFPEAVADLDGAGRRAGGGAPQRAAP